MLSPFIALPLGLLYEGLRPPMAPNAWPALVFLDSLVKGLLVGATLCCLFAVISKRKGERGAIYALFAAVPSALFLVWIAVLFFTGRY